MRGIDEILLHGSCLAAEGEIYMDWEFPQMEYQRLFYYDVVECKPFVFTSVEDRVCSQIQLLTTFMKVGDHLKVLEDFRTQVGILIGNAASTSDFN